MPIYEYQCDACGASHEALQKVSDAPLEICPYCHKQALRKKVSAAAFRLKGGGWYETDFKKGDNKKNLAGDKAGSGSDKSDSKSSSSDNKSDKKPASTSAAAK